MIRLLLIIILLHVSLLANAKTITLGDKEIKLMLQSFLYANDLDNAYAIAKIGYERNPDSYYWNQKMAEVCRWSGRGEEAMKYLRFLYKKEHTQKLAQEIIDYGLSAYQYEAIEDIVTQQAFASPTQKNIQRMVYIYSQTGEPQKAAKLLHKLYLKTNDADLLTQELQIYMNDGNLQEAKLIVDYIQKKQLYSTKNLPLISYYYYLKRNIQEAFNVLRYAHPQQAYDKKLYTLESDLGWYLQKYRYAAGISLQLVKHKDGRLVDYERIIYANKDTDPKLTATMALQAYKKFHHSYLFYTFATNAIKTKEFTLLQNVMKEIDASPTKLTQESNYWLIKAQLYFHFKQALKARLALHKALKYNKDNIQLQFSVIDFSLQYGFYNDAKEILQTISQNTQLPHSLYFPVAMLYYTLHDINLATFYVDKLQEENAPVTQTLPFHFLHLDLYRARVNQPAVMHEIRTIEQKLQKELLKNPKNIQSDHYLYDYLRVHMYTDNPDIFEKSLKDAKKHLTKAHYDDIAYAWATRNNADELAHAIYLQTPKKEIWLELSNALAQQEHSKIEDLLFAYLQTLPRNDAAYGAENDGQIALAQSLSYKALNTNQRDQNAYISWRDLIKKRSDRFEAKTAYYHRNPLLRKYATLKNRAYINDAYSLSTNVEYYKNSSLDNTVLLSTPSQSSAVNFGIRKLFDRGSLELLGGYANSMKAYSTFSLLGSYVYSSRLSIKSELAKNKTCDESVQMLLGGKKDMLSATLLYNILNSTTLEFRYDKNNYKSQDNVAIGKGDYFSLNLGYQIRNGYPDMHIGLFSDGGIYSENEGSKGVIDRLQDGRYKVLPKDFYNLGLTFSYGMQNSELYTRVWRPYFEGLGYYNSEINDFTFGLSAGYGGKVYSQDHLVVGANYTNSVNGIGGSILELFLRYEFVYTHR